MAGVFVVSLAAVQEEAHAEPMLSSWYGPGLEGNVTAILLGSVLLQILYGRSKKLGAISEPAKSDVASIAKKLTYSVRRVAVVDHKPANLFFGAAANGASAFLSLKHRLTLLAVYTTTMLGAVAAHLFRVLKRIGFVNLIDARLAPREPSVLLGLRAPVELLDRFRFATLRTSLFARMQDSFFSGLAHSVLVAPLVLFTRNRVFVRHVPILAAVLAISLVFSTPAKAETMVASWYGPGFEGATTASGEVFDPYSDYTAASLYYPMGTMLEVCYVDCTVVRVNDLGPYVAGRDLDLSQAAAEDVGLTAAGTDVVEVEVLE